nr:Rnase Y domain-containing protein [Prolixibacteraceae bacterium]
MDWTYILIVAAFVLGFPISYVIWDRALKSKRVKQLREAKAEAEVIKKDKILQAKEKFLQLKSDHERYINEKNNKISI